MTSISYPSIISLLKSSAHELRVAREGETRIQLSRVSAGLDVSLKDGEKLLFARRNYARICEALVQAS